MKRIRILLADDHSVVRSGLRSLFKTGTGFAVVGEVANGEDAVKMVQRLKPDVVILDISMPVMGGIEATRIIKQKFPDVGVLILTIHASEEYIYEMIKAGANGYVLKDAEKHEIFAAVRSVAVAEPFFSSNVSKVIVERIVKKAAPVETKEPAQNENLTKREQEILRMIAKGLTSREIADKLYLSLSTINTHRANLMQKLNIHDTARLVRFAIREGLFKEETATP